MSGLQIFKVSSPIPEEFLESACLKTLVLAALWEGFENTLENNAASTNVLKCADSRNSAEIGELTLKI